MGKMRKIKAIQLNHGDTVKLSSRSKTIWTCINSSEWSKTIQPPKGATRYYLDTVHIKEFNETLTLVNKITDIYQGDYHPITALSPYWVTVSRVSKNNVFYSANCGTDKQRSLPIQAFEKYMYERVQIYAERVARIRWELKSIQLHNFYKRNSGVSYEGCTHKEGINQLMGLWPAASPPNWDIQPNYEEIQFGLWRGDVGIANQIAKEIFRGDNNIAREIMDKEKRVGYVLDIEAATQKYIKLYKYWNEEEIKAGEKPTLPPWWPDWERLLR